MSGLLDDRFDSGLMGDASSRAERLSNPTATSDRGTARKRGRPCQVPAGSRAISVVARYGARHNAGQARAFTSRGHDGKWEKGNAREDYALHQGHAAHWSSRPTPHGKQPPTAVSGTGERWEPAVVVGGVGPCEHGIRGTGTRGHVLDATFGMPNHEVTDHLRRLRTEGRMWRVKRKAERGKHFRTRADHRESRPGNYPPARPAGPPEGRGAAGIVRRGRSAGESRGSDRCGAGPAGGGLHLESRARPAGVEGDGPISTPVREREREGEGEGEGNGEGMGSPQGWQRPTARRRAAEGPRRKRRGGVLESEWHHDEHDLRFRAVLAAGHSGLTYTKRRGKGEK
jgi:hypothetical protein